MSKNNNGSTQLRFLQVGESFEIPQLSDTMKNLTVLRSSDCGVLVTGEIREDEKSGWKRETTRICSTILVAPTGVLNKIIVDEKGGFSVQNENGESVSFESTTKRGRKSAENKFIWPKSKFTFKQLAEKMGIPYHVIAIAFHKEREKFEKVGAVELAGKGKRPVIWRLKK